MIDDYSKNRTGWARFSDDKVMRYRLARSLTGAPLDRHSGGRCVFVLLNPSTADAFVLDPTVTRCISFARSWGYGVLEVVNIFALRATDPRELRRVQVDRRGDDPIATSQLLSACAGAARVVAGWGRHGTLSSRGNIIKATLRLNGVKLHHLGLNKDGSPKHPLYLKGDTEPKEWTDTAEDKR